MPDLVALFLVVALFYFPTAVAFWRRHDKRWRIAGVNLLFGPIGTVIAALWVFRPSFEESGVPVDGDDRLACAQCGRAYDPAEYRGDAEEWRCSYCHEPVAPVVGAA